MLSVECNPVWGLRRDWLGPPHEKILKVYVHNDVRAELHLNNKGFVDVVLLFAQDLFFWIFIGYGLT